jgi:ankyrin repeat protein
MENEPFCFPQELEDIIFLYLNMSTLVECRTLQSNYVKKCTEYFSLQTAVEKGNLHCVRYLLSSLEDWGYWLDTLIEWAALNGHLDIVIWLHFNKTEGCPYKAMDMAAANGHLDIVIWLHFNRTEGCTTSAMDNAAANGHLEVVKFLHENRTEGCTTYAMDLAAQNGHLEVLKWLH